MWLLRHKHITHPHSFHLFRFLLAWERRQLKHSVILFFIINHALCLLSAFLFISVLPALAFIFLHLLPMVLFGFLSHCSSSRRCLALALVAVFSQGSVTIIYSAFLFKPSGFFYSIVQMDELFYESYYI